MGASLQKLREGARRGFFASAGNNSHSRSIFREPFPRKVRDVVGDCTTALQRPWIRRPSKHGRQHVFLVKKRTLGVEIIRQGPLPNVADVNNNPIRMTGLVDLMVRLGTRIAKTEFIVCEKIAAPVILVCDFCDRFVEAIYPRKKNIELNDGSTVPIVSRPLKRSPKSPPLSASQEYVKTEGRTSPKVRVSQNITLSPETQTWVSVKSDCHGVMVLQPYDKFYEGKGIIVTNGFIKV